MTNMEEPVGLGRDDGDEVAIRVIPGKGAIVLPTRMKNLTEDQVDDVVELQHQARRVIDAHHSIGIALANGRAHGLSWASLGWCIGMTAQGAQAMHDRLARERELIAQMEAGTDS